MIVTLLVVVLSRAVVLAAPSRSRRPPGSAFWHVYFDQGIHRAARDVGLSRSE